MGAERIYIREETYMGLFGFGKMKEARANNCTVEIIGVYSVPESPDVKLVEILAECTPSEIDVGKFTQQEDGVPESNWQVAYDEYYLNKEGTEVVGR